MLTRPKVDLCGCTDEWPWCLTPILRRRDTPSSSRVTSASSNFPSPVSHPLPRKRSAPKRWTKATSPSWARDPHARDLILYSAWRSIDGRNREGTSKIAPAKHVHWIHVGRSSIRHSTHAFVSGSRQAHQGRAERPPNARDWTSALLIFPWVNQNIG